MQLHDRVPGGPPGPAGRISAQATDYPLSCRQLKSLCVADHAGLRHAVLSMCPKVTLPEHCHCAATVDPPPQTCGACAMVEVASEDQSDALVLARARPEFAAISAEVAWVQVRLGAAGGEVRCSGWLAGSD